MDFFLRLLVPLLFFTLTGRLILVFFPETWEKFGDALDRFLLSFLAGMAFYPLFFLVVQGTFGLPLTRASLIGAFLVLFLANRLWKEYQKRTASPSRKTQPLPQDWIHVAVIALLLAVVFYFALDVRLQNTLEFPGQLLHSDPYRHHIRTEAILQTGRISKWDPYIVGQVPIYELQGCYVLAAVISLLSGFTAHDLWRFGAPILGALSVIPVYLLCKYSLVLLLDSGGTSTQVSKKRGLSAFLENRWTLSWIGLIAAALLAASPIHILRTNAGFSEALAMPFFALSVLFYLLFASDPQIETSLLFGLFFTALTICNPVPAVYLVPLFFVHALYYFLKTKNLKLVYGLLIAAAIGGLTVFVWSHAFLGVPVKVGLWANKEAGTEGLMTALKVKPGVLNSLKECWDSFSKEVGKNLSWAQLVLGGMGALFILRQKKKWQLEVTGSFYFLFYFLYLLLIFFIPFGIPSFTSKYYRNFLPASYAVAILSAYALYRMVSFSFENRWIRQSLLAALFAFSVAYAAEAGTWGKWVLDCSPEEFQAAEWINKNASPNAFLLGNWYTNDFMRSLTFRNTLIVDFPRSIVQYGMERAPLEIPILKPDPEGILAYLDRHPGDYYLVTSQWGPAAIYEGNRRFQKAAEFGTGKKTMARIYRIVK